MSDRLEQQREEVRFRVLRLIESNPEISQRELADELGVSLGQINYQLKALKERGFEEKRESTSGKNVNYGNLIRFDEYKRNKLGQVELLRAVDPLLTKYYKDKAGKYFNQF